MSSTPVQTPDLKDANTPPSKPTRISPPAVPFTPCHMFFYGSLMDPTQLSYITNHTLTTTSTTPPILTPTTITGFRMKMWSIYPTLIATSNPTNSNKVTGMLWKCDTEAQFQRLAAYETDAYTWCFCTAELDDGSGTLMRGVRTFCWAGEPDSEELTEGVFDLERWKWRAYSSF
ncbi:hypothetical protein LARI1_G004191 [Lachnellula arida]|uniref:Putative gamma-glutamylcyclotransferase n=1 Tax=Lachnellula arida TaxID=1316785 RepID=A0A8T9BDL0_9HELO|nr:hypothetical protein LARI1_G004191 [Lachnellula arida]